MSWLKKLRFNGSDFLNVLSCDILHVDGHSWFLLNGLNLSDILLLIYSLLVKSFFWTLKKLPNHGHFLPLCNHWSWWRSLKIIIFLCDIDVGIRLNYIEILRFLKNVIAPWIHSFVLRIIWISVEIQWQLVCLLTCTRFVHLFSVDLTCRWIMLCAIHKISVQIFKLVTSESTFVSISIALLRPVRW